MNRHRTVAVEGYYLEGGQSASTPDVFSFTNTGEGDIVTIQIRVDINTYRENNPQSPTFDPSDVPFAVTSTDDVGFSGSFTQPFNIEPFNNPSVYLSFTDFNPGERFTFVTDVDDANGAYTTGADFQYSELRVIGYASGAEGIFFVDPTNTNRATVVTEVSD